MIDINMQGTLTALSHITIAHKDAPDAERGLVMTTIPHEGGPVRMPEIPGSSLKGLLRAKCGAVEARGRTMSLDVYNILFKGGIKGDEKESTDDLRRHAEFRETSPLVGLFGAAAPQWAKGRLVVRSAQALSPDKVVIVGVGGARRDDFKQNPETLGLLDDQGIADYYDYAETMKAVSRANAETIDLGRRIVKAKKAKRDGGEGESVAEIEALLKENEARIAKLKESDNYANAVGRPLPGVPAIGAGSVFSHGFDARGISYAEFGLFLAGLKELSELCSIGGHASTGYGLFEATYRLKVREAGGDWESAGSIAVGPMNFVVDGDNAFVKRAQRAWEEVAGKGVERVAAFVSKPAKAAKKVAEEA